MSLRLRALILVCLVSAMPACLPSAAWAAPTLSSPAANASSFKVGASMAFEWQGNLEGDTTAVNQAFFRLEIVKAADLPPGTQAEWPDGILETYYQTEPGRTMNSATMGVPTEGSYRWRVCAWGVVNDMVANQVQQLPEGCSGSRPFSTTATASTGSTIGEVAVEETVQVDGPVTVRKVTRPGSTTTAQPVADQTDTSAETSAAPSVSGPAEFQSVASPESTKKTRTGKPTSLVSLAPASASDVDAPGDVGAMGQVGSAVSTVFNASIPGIPIPFWTLVLLFACLPIVRMWRAGVVSMFDWPDGAIDGMGTPASSPDLASVAVASEFKFRTSSADGVAPPALAADSVPDRGRWAA